MSLFQSNLRKQIRNLPKILNFVKKNHYYSKLFTSLLSRSPPPRRARCGRRPRGRPARSPASRAGSSRGCRGPRRGSSARCAPRSIGVWSDVLIFSPFRNLLKVLGCIDADFLQRLQTYFKGFFKRYEDVISASFQIYFECPGLLYRVLQFSAHFIEG